MPTRRWLSPIDLMVIMWRSSLGLLAAAIVTIPAMLVSTPDWHHAEAAHPNASACICTIVWALAAFGVFCDALFATDSRTLNDVREGRVTRWRQRAVRTEPDGEWVRLWLHERGQNPVYHRLHAESEAERAHEIVAEFRTKPTRESTSTPEARALARTLAR